MDWLMMFGLGLVLIAHLWTDRHYKRKLACEKERLGHANSALHRSAVNYRTLYEEMCQWDDDICGMLGEMSAFRRHTTVVDTLSPIHEVEVYPPRVVAVDPSVKHPEHVAVAEVSRERMYRFMLTIETRIDTLQRFIRFEECNKKADTRVLVVSDSLFDAVGLGGREHRWVVEESIRELLRAFKKERGEVI